jgi:hypothetical protein
MVAVRDVGMVSRRFLLTAGFVFGRFSVMTGCMFMMLRRSFVMFCTFFTHKERIGEVSFRGLL